MEETEAKTFHESLTRPGFLMALALAAGHGMAFGAGTTDWVAWTVAAAAGVVLLLFRRPSHFAFAIGLILLFIGIGGIQESRVIRDEKRGLFMLSNLADGGSPIAQAKGVLDFDPRPSATGWNAVLKPGAVIASRGREFRLPAPIAVRFQRNEQTNRQMAGLTAGRSLTVAGKLLELPDGRYSSDPGGWLRSRGAVGLLRAEMAFPRDGPSNPWQNFRRLARIHANEIENDVMKTLPPREASIVTAATLGRTHHLSPEQREGFRRAGLLHLFAVSGLHTMLIGLLAIGLLRLMGLPARWRFLALCILLIYFAALTGMRSSVLRAASLLLVWEGRQVIRRPIEPLAALGTVAAILMLISPRAIWQVDFQMTLLCALTLILASPWMEALQQTLGAKVGWRGHFAVRAAQVFLASTLIQIALAPLLIAMFGEFSLISPVANLLVLPVMAIVVKISFLAYFIGLAMPGLEELILLGVRWPVLLCGRVAEWLGALPFAAIESPPLPVSFVLIYYLILLTAPWNRFRESARPRRPAAKFAPAALGLLFIIAWLPLISLRGPLLTVWFFDVGQGDAIVLRTQDGQTMMVDAGPETSAWLLPSMLKEHGITRLDLLVATHADADHVGGMDAVVEALEVKKLAVGGSVARTKSFEGLADAVSSRKVPIIKIGRGTSWTLGGGAVAVKVLHPTESFVERGLERNEASVVLLVEAGGRRILLTGDAEAKAEAEMLAEGLIGPVDVLKAGHHGARSSTSAELLAAALPGTVVLSCGVNNRYGHPAPELMERLERLGCAIRRTDLEGTLRLEIRKDGTMRWFATRAD